MANILGNTHTDAAKAKMSAAQQLAYAKPERREQQRRARLGYKHSAETKAKMSATARRKLAEEPAFAKMRTANALRNSQLARDKYLQRLGVTGQVLGDIPLAKSDAARLREFPCALCGTVDQPRELAHIRARFGERLRYTWGNVIPLCIACHDRVDHGTETLVTGI
jgi:5-methylcytosine-specific restriction endonuclease McrA